MELWIYKEDNLYHTMAKPKISKIKKLQTNKGKQQEDSQSQKIEAYKHLLTCKQAKRPPLPVRQFLKGTASTLDRKFKHDAWFKNSTNSYIKPSHVLEPLCSSVVALKLTHSFLLVNLFDWFLHRRVISEVTHMMYLSIPQS